MSTHTATVADTNQAAEMPHQRDRRLAQVIVAVLACLTICSAASLACDRFADTVLIGLAAVLLAAALSLVRRSRVETGVTLFLSTLTAMASSLAWLNHGARDTAILAFPGILLFAGMFGSRRLLVALLTLMIAATSAIVTADMNGWRTAGLRPESYAIVVNIAGILVITAYGVWLFTDDLHRTLRALVLENRLVRQSQAEIERICGHDALTGLPNRVVARDRLVQALARSARLGRCCAALALDLDQFKTVNDSLGHAAGDELLRQAGARLSALVDAGDTVCRLGGDEFLLLAELDDADKVAAFATRVLDSLSSPFRMQGVEVTTSASMGIAVCPADGATFDEVLKNVDIAMYQAKREGGHTFRFFDSRMNAGVIEHTTLLTGMRAGLPRGEFQLHYQPQFDLRSGRLIGAEALLRWRHPTLGAVPPGRFVPIAESSGFIVELGAWVLRRACQQVAAWQGRLGDGFRVSVNLSPVQFRRGDIERVLQNALEDCALPAQRLEVEITESMLVEDSHDLRGTLERLRKLGVTFAIDDFGTGYSNLAYLKRFEVGRLKIDQSFIRRLTQDPQDQAIVGAIIQMTSRLGLTTIAEGVEDGQTLALLCALGCDEGQGFHWSAAVPADDFAARWLETADESVAG